MQANFLKNLTIYWFKAYPGIWDQYDTVQSFNKLKQEVNTSGKISR